MTNQVLYCHCYSAVHVCPRIHPNAQVLLLHKEFEIMKVACLECSKGILFFTAFFFIVGLLFHEKLNNGGSKNSSGVLYTRWGKSSCPDTPGTELFYSGRVGGTWYNLEGGGANYLCMPEDPDYDPSLKYQSGVSDWARVYGAEYEYPLQGTHNHNAPCAVCYVSSRSNVVMIPAKSICPSSWTREYHGYLMTEWKGVPPNIRGRTMFECVDKDQESVPGGAGNEDGVLFYHVEASCTGLPCPPYNEEQELNCVVCTK